MDYTVHPVSRINGTVRSPADKSVAHRSAIFAAIADGVSRIHGYPRGADTLSTIQCLVGLGVKIVWEGDTLVVEGKGLGGLREPTAPLDCGNSGTTMRLLSGLLAGQNFSTELTGDASLRARPMERIARPLRLMGASVHLDHGRAPIRIEGNSSLRGIEYELPMASAQVKSAVLLAGLYAQGETTVIERIPTRDHTERMLGLEQRSKKGLTSITSHAAVIPPVADMALPGDISSAAYFMAAGLIVPNSSVSLLGVGVNPTRSGIVDVLTEAGGLLEATNHRTVGREPVCDFHVRSANLRLIRVLPAIVPRLIDEIPILAVIASQAVGISSFTGIGELRAKESDRIDAVSSSLTALGATVVASETSLEITGPVQLQGGSIDSRNDHRIAMAMAIAGLVSSGPTHISGAEAANVSYPGFWGDLERLGIG